MVVWHVEPAEKSKINSAKSLTTTLTSTLRRWLAADGIILGSPTYFSMMTSEMKALIDRAGFVGRSNGDLFKRKVGAAVVAVRRAGGIPTFDAINHFFLISQMIVPGSSYWNVGIGLAKGDVEKDEEGLKTMDDLGKNMAWLIKKVKRLKLFTIALLVLHLESSFSHRLCPSFWRSQ